MPPCRKMAFCATKMCPCVLRLCPCAVQLSPCVPGLFPCVLKLLLCAILQIFFASVRQCPGSGWASFCSESLFFSKTGSLPVALFEFQCQSWVFRTASRLFGKTALLSLLYGASCLELKVFRNVSLILFSGLMLPFSHFRLMCSS